MSRGFVERDSANGEFSPRIRADVNRMLDIYCRINGKNKTAFVNELIAERMNEIFNKLKEEE